MFKDKSEIISPGEQFRSKRSTSSKNPKLTVVYEDDLTVVLETQENGERLHRYEPRNQFEAGIGNQWEHIGATNQSTSDKEDTPIDQIISGLKCQLKSYKKDDQVQMMGVRQHTLNNIIKILESSPYIEEIDLESINGIGEKTAQTLREEGIKTTFDILCSSIEYLSSIDGVGEKTAQNLKDKAGAQSLPDSIKHN